MREMAHNSTASVHAHVRSQVTQPAERAAKERAMMLSGDMAAQEDEIDRVNDGSRGAALQSSISTRSQATFQMPFAITTRALGPLGPGRRVGKTSQACPKTVRYVPWRECRIVSLQRVGDSFSWMSREAFRRISHAQAFVWERRPRDKMRVAKKEADDGRVLVRIWRDCCTPMMHSTNLFAATDRNIVEGVKDVVGRSKRGRNTDTTWF